MKELIARVLCRLFGHRYVVESSVGPESGSEDIYCERCGLDHHIIYY